MTILPYRTALIVGAMASLGAALARTLAIEGPKAGPVARDVEVRLRPRLERF